MTMGNSHNGFLAKTKLKQSENCPLKLRSKAEAALQLPDELETTRVYELSKMRMRTIVVVLATEHFLKTYFLLG